MWDLIQELVRVVSGEQATPNEIGLCVALFTVLLGWVGREIAGISTRREHRRQVDWLQRQVEELQRAVLREHEVTVLTPQLVKPTTKRARRATKRKGPEE